MVWQLGIDWPGQIYYRYFLIVAHEYPTFKILNTYTMHNFDSHSLCARLFYFCRIIAKRVVDFFSISYNWTDHCKYFIFALTDIKLLFDVGLKKNWNTWGHENIYSLFSIIQEFVESEKCAILMFTGWTTSNYTSIFYILYLSEINLTTYKGEGL